MGRRSLRSSLILLFLAKESLAAIAFMNASKGSSMYPSLSTAGWR